MPRRPIGDVAMTGAERVRRYRLKHAAGKPAAAGEPDAAHVFSLQAQLAQARGEIEALREANLKLDMELTILRRRLAQAEETKPPRAARAPKPPTEPDEEIAKLKKKIRELRAELRHIVQRTHGNLTVAKAAYRDVVRCLHPDTAMGDPTRQQRLTKAFQIFSGWPIKIVDVGD
jgi:regulator of replication initiation timing